MKKAWQGILPGLFNIWIWITTYPVLRNPAEMPLMVAART